MLQQVGKQMRGRWCDASVSAVQAQQRAAEAAVAAELRFTEEQRRNGKRLRALVRQSDSRLASLQEAAEARVRP